jgi:branched-chain amino acid transport system substrate-binding protein
LYKTTKQPLLLRLQDFSTSTATRATPGSVLDSVWQCEFACSQFFSEGHLGNHITKWRQRMNTLKQIVGTLTLAGMTAGSFAADLKIGFITALSGHNAAQGVQFSLGMKAAVAAKSKVDGHTIRVITLDDASDPSTAARNARKLIEEEKVDILIGSSSVPASLAIAAVARESGTPQIALPPLGIPKEERGWTFSVTQPVDIMVSAIVESMKKSGIRNIGYIGFADPFGDQMYRDLVSASNAAGMKVVTNERYARADTSVTAQVLKTMAARPDAVVTGVAGAVGALPYIALAERGYRGALYGTHGQVHSEFVRVAGSYAEGMFAPTGPVVVAEQLPLNNPIRKAALDFRDAYQRANGALADDGYSAYAFDAYMLFANAASRVTKKSEPGSKEFRTALRDAITTTKDFVGAHAVYNFAPGQVSGVDERARVMVKLEKGKWKLQP